MKDLEEKLEKLLMEADDCDIIGRLATDKQKRELFKKLATDLRSMARDIEAMIAGSQADGITSDTTRYPQFSRRRTMFRHR
jgi:hypothetical protein